MTDLPHLTAQWVGLIAIAFAAVSAFGAIAARSAFAMILHLIVVVALAAVALAAMNAGGAALGLALVGVAIVPFLLMGAMLLSAHASKRNSLPWMSAALGAAALLPIGWALADLHAAPLPANFGAGISGLWLALTVFVTACACVGMLGFGERGIMQRLPEAMRHED